MSSWPVSLRWIDGRMIRLRRGVEKYGLRAPGVGDDFFKAGPGRLVAEAGAKIVQQCRDLRIVHARGKSRHDRTAFALHWSQPGQYRVDDISRIRIADPGGETEIDSAVGWRPAGVMTAGASRGVDRRACGFGGSLRRRGSGLRPQLVRPSRAVRRRRAEFLCHIDGDGVDVAVRNR